MGYPPDRGRLSTRYSPVRHFTRPANRAFSCDLHVLGMPPAFILSQDQTLQLNWDIYFPHSGSLFSFQRANSAIWYYRHFFAAVKGDFLGPAFLPPSGASFCNPSPDACQGTFWLFFPRRGHSLPAPMLNQSMIAYQNPDASPL